MPLTAEYTWAESDTTIQLQIPLKGQPKSKVDVYSTECYLKASFSPYLLELDLHGYIDSTQPRARVQDGTLFIKAKKKEGHEGIWGSLGQRVDRRCTPDVKARREESIKEQFKREQELKERVGLRKHHDERLALRSQMKVEEAERRLIEDLKAEEKEKAEAEVYKAFAEMAAEQNETRPMRDGAVIGPVAQPKRLADGDKGHAPQCANSAHIATEVKSCGYLNPIPEDVMSEEGDQACSTSMVDCRSTRGAIWDEASDGVIDARNADRMAHEDIEADTTMCESGATQDFVRHNEAGNQCMSGGDDEANAVSYVPAPRVPVGVVPISFTTRLFPTPLRESKVADESAWIMKNRRHLHKNKTLVGRLPSNSECDLERDGLPIDISESDPVWLKDKGDELYRGGDFLAAVNAYTAAFDADPQATACLSNRAACHLRLGRASECVADCGAALEILRTLPETGPNQARALARRALAYRELGHYKLSLDDCRDALGFNPGDATLQREIAISEPLALCEAAKKEAVVCFASGDIAEACRLYTNALSAVPTFPSCLSNRAACHLALGRPQDCVDDCTATLEILSAGSSTRPYEQSEEQDHTLLRPRLLLPPPGSAPPIGSNKRRQWVVSTMLRRGRANVELGRLESALHDYQAADSLAPGDKAVEGDVHELERLVREAETPLTH